MIDGFKAWLDHPFRADMSAQRWLAFVGLLLAILVFWRIILSHLESA